MNVFTQAVLYWTLLGLLLAWMIISALLAVRPEPRERTRITREETPAPSSAFAFTQMPAMLQVITPQPIPVAAHAGHESTDTSMDMH